MRIGTYVLEETSGLSPHWNMPSLTQTISDCGTAIEDVIDSRGRRFANHYCCFAVRSAAERMSLFYVGFFNSLFPFNTVPNMDERQINTIHHLLKEKTWTRKCVLFVSSVGPSAGANAWYDWLLAMYLTLGISFVWTVNSKQ